MNKKSLLVILLILVVLLVAGLMWIWPPADNAAPAQNVAPAKTPAAPLKTAEVEMPKLGPAVPDEVSATNPAASARPAGTLPASMSPEQQALRQQKRDNFLQNVQEMQAERDKLLADAGSDQERESITSRYRLRISMAQDLADMFSEPPPPPVDLGVVSLVGDKPTTVQVDDHTQATITLQSSSGGNQSYVVDISHINPGGGIVHAANGQSVKAGEPVTFTWNFYELHFTPELITPAPDENL
jgi:type IV secretory pathway VirB10-like protein